MAPLHQSLHPVVELIKRQQDAVRDGTFPANESASCHLDVDILCELSQYIRRRTSFKAVEATPREYEFISLLTQVVGGKNRREVRNRFYKNHPTVRHGHQEDILEWVRWMTVGDESSRHKSWTVQEAALNSARFVSFEKMLLCDSNLLSSDSDAKCDDIYQHYRQPWMTVGSGWFDKQSNPPFHPDPIFYTNVEDAVRRMIMQNDASQHGCVVQGCQGKRLRRTDLSAVNLPDVLIVASTCMPKYDENLSVGPAKYTLTAVAFRLPGHYICNVKLYPPASTLTLQWYSYNDLDGGRVFPCADFTRPATVSTSATTRALYFVRTDHRTSNSVNLIEEAYRLYNGRSQYYSISDEIEV